MPFYVYILRCSDGSFCTGHSENLEIRIAEHQSGEFHGYTKKRQPVELVFSDEFPTREEALDREKQIKGWRRAKKEALISGDWEWLRDLSKSRDRTNETNSKPRCGSQL